MNWIGGARARAKIKEQFNGRSNPNRLGNQQNFGGPSSDNENEEDESGESFEEDVDQGRGVDQFQNRMNGESRRTKRKSSAPKPETYARKNIDYTTLGYRLARPSKVQRRVVPLLEFLEKEIPKGQVLSLQLSHLMDITRTPRPGEAARGRPVSSMSSATSPRTVNSTYTVRSSPEPGPSNRANLFPINLVASTTNGMMGAGASSTTSNTSVTSSQTSDNSSRSNISSHVTHVRGSDSTTTNTSNGTEDQNNFKVPAVPPPHAPSLHFPLIDDDDDEQDIESGIMIQ